MGKELGPCRKENFGRKNVGDQKIVGYLGRRLLIYLHLEVGFYDSLLEILQIVTKGVVVRPMTSLLVM